MTPKFLKKIFTKPNGDNNNNNDNNYKPLASLHHPPFEYICPICFSLMSDPVTLPSSDRSFHLNCLQAYHQRNPLPEFAPIHNHTLRAQIQQWCEQHGRLPPPPVPRWRAQEAARIMHKTSPNSNQEPVPPPSPLTAVTTRSNIENILMKLRESRTSSRQDALTALAEYTNPNNRTLLCRSVILDSVLSMFFTYSPNTTTAATAFLLNLSTESSTRYMIAHHFDAALVSRLLDTVANGYAGMITPDARDEASATLYNLTLELRNKILMGSIHGLLSGLVEYWIGESTASHRGRQSAGWAVKNLVTSCPENVVRLVGEEERVVERVLGLARKKEEGNVTVRRPAFLVLAEMAKEKTGRTKVVNGRAMDEMVGMLWEREAEKWCLDVMWWMCFGGMSKWEFKVVAKEAGAEEVLSEMREEWGNDGLKKADEMLKVMRKKYRVKGQPKPLDLLDPVAEEGSQEEEEEEEDGDDGGGGGGGGGITRDEGSSSSSSSGFGVS